MLSAALPASTSRERRQWTAEEDELLRMAVNREEPGNPAPSKWHAIAQHVPNRTNKDCRKRWYAKMNSDVVKGGWAPDEDQRLLNAIEFYGTRWSLVASMVQTRNSDQCAKRWCDTLNPAIDRTAWTASQDDLLVQAVNEHGKVWTKIVQMYFPGRTGLAAKNRYNSLTRAEGSSRGGSSSSRRRRATPDSSPSPSMELDALDTAVGYPGTGTRYPPCGSPYAIPQSGSQSDYHAMPSLAVSANLRPHSFSGPSPSTQPRPHSAMPAFGGSYPMPPLTGGSPSAYYSSGHPSSSSSGTAYSGDTAPDYALGHSQRGGYPQQQQQYPNTGYNSGSGASTYAAYPSSSNNSVPGAARNWVSTAPSRSLWVGGY